MNDLPAQKAFAEFLGALKEQCNLQNGEICKFEIEFKLFADNSVETFNACLTVR